MTSTTISKDKTKLILGVIFSAHLNNKFSVRAQRGSCLLPRVNNPARIHIFLRLNLISFQSIVKKMLRVCVRFLRIYTQTTILIFLFFSVRDIFNAKQDEFTTELQTKTLS